MRFIKKKKFSEQEKYPLFMLFLLVYASMWLYSFIQESQWLIDNSIAILALVLMFYISEKIRLKKTGFIVFNIALLSHNMGTFGFYELSFGMFQYDNLVHLLSSIVTAYIIFKLVIEKFHTWPKITFKHNKTLFIFFVISASVALGVVIEIVEFTGDKFLGEGEGILLRGSGDSDPAGEGIASQYNDTMQDLIVNMIGSIIGALGFYYIRIR